MYNCDICKKTTLPKTACIRITTETRQKTYQARQSVNRIASWKDDRADKINSTGDAGGKGTEIVKELKVCPTCATIQQAKTVLK